jgi:hypothetical protein
MTLKLNLKIKLTCPKHRKYNPELHGLGGIKGGCNHCSRLYVLHSSATDLQDCAAGVADDIEKFLGEREKDRIGLEA